MINAYLQSKAELDDRAIHLLFAANRWECAYVEPPPSPLHPCSPNTSEPQSSVTSQRASQS